MDEAISHVYWLDPPVGAGLLWIKPLHFARQPARRGEDSSEVMTQTAG